MIYGQKIEKQYLKRIFDIVVSIVTIIIFLPVFVLIAFLIKVESILNPAAKGPVIHSEIRISKGKRFKMYKFRIVRWDLLRGVKKNHERVSQSFLQYEPGALTSVGRFLAKFYLDELPQLFNILKGDMSFVGPRPQPISVYKRWLKWGNCSLQVLKGGLCGLSQASKRNPKLRQALRDAFRTEELNPRIRSLERIYLTKYKSYSAPELFIYDIKLMFMTLKVNLEGKGVGSLKKRHKIKRRHLS